MAAASTHEYRVLVVDDCESLRYLKTHYLLEAGYRVSQADTGTGAIRSIEEERPDLVLLDVNLPDRHGSEVCREVKMRWALPVVYTSSVDIPAELHGTSDGCQVSLEKAELLDTVRKALGNPSHPMPQPNGGLTGESAGISCTKGSSSAEIATQAHLRGRVVERGDGRFRGVHDRFKREPSDHFLQSCRADPGRRCKPKGDVGVAVGRAVSLRARHKNVGRP